MKQLLKFSFLLVLVVSVAGCNRDSSNISVNGILKVPMELPVWIGDMNIDKVIPLDSTFTNEQGQFSLQVYCNEPSLYLLNIGPKSIYLVLKPKDNVLIELNNSGGSASYYVEGSTDSRLVQELITKQERVLEEITRISMEYEQSKINPENFTEKKAQLDLQYNELLEKHKSYTKEVIYNNPNSLACIFALYQNFGRTNQALFNKFDDFEVYNFIDSTLSLKYPNTSAVKALNRDVTDIRNQIKYKNYADKLIEPGKKAPEFEITTIENKNINLSDYSGNPVIYFFFATWNKQSVEEALALNEIFKRYRYRGLKVVGVSFDSSEEHLKAFIDENDILFPIACDYKYWESGYVNQFGIKQIPHILLVNPQHIIEQQNINITELNHILSEWRKSNIH